jgi:hypothetical protein
MLSSVTMSKQTDVLHYLRMSMIAYADSLPLLFRWDGCQDVKQQGRGAEKGGTDPVTNKWAEVSAERPAPSGPIGRRAAATAAPVATSARAAACCRHSESYSPRATLVASLTTLFDFYLKGAGLPCSFITPPRCPPSVQLLFCSLTDFSNLSVAALLPALEPV